MTLGLGEAYKRLGHEIEYFSYQDLPRNLPHKARQVLFPIFVVHRIRRLSRSAPLDVIDASTADTSLWLVLRRWRRAAGPVVVTRSHGLEHTAREVLLKVVAEAGERLGWKYPLYNGGLRLREVAFTLRRSDASLFLNENERLYAVDHLGVDPARATVVQNGLPDFLLGLPRPVARQVGMPVGIAQIGSYIRGKGISHGAAALGPVLAAHSDVFVSFLGTGCGRARVLTDFAPELHDRIKVVPGFDRAELPALLTGHHIKFFPTYSEGFSLALLEAMACGLAPVATATPGTSSAVEHEGSGLVVPPRDSDALRTELERLLTDSALLERLRKNAYERAQLFRWDRIAADTLTFYRRAQAESDSGGSLQ